MLRWVIALLVLANVGYFAWTQGALSPLGLAPVQQSEPERLQAQIKPEALRLLNGPKGSAAASVPAPPAAAASPVPAVAADEPPAPAATPPVPEATPTAAPSAADKPGAASPTASTTAPGATPSTTPSISAQVTPLAAPQAAPRTACWQAGGYTTAQADALRSALADTGLSAASWRLNEAKTGGRWVVYMGRYNDEQLDRKKSELTLLGVGFRTLPPPLGPGLALGTYSSEAAAEQGLQDVAKKGVRTARVVAERAEGSAWTLRLPAVTDAQRQSVAGLGAVLAGKRLQPCN